VIGFLPESSVSMLKKAILTPELRSPHYFAAQFR
jgi:hypothetical protein